VQKPAVVNSKKTTHLVQPKETLFSLSRQYNVSVDAIKNANAELLKDGLKIGQNVLIPASDGISEVVENKPEVKPTETVKTTVKEEVKTLVAKPTSTSKTIYHTVEAKETKFGISKKYGITIESLEKLNPQIVSGLQVGTKLLISGERTVSDEVAPMVKTKSEPIKDAVSTKKYLQEYVVRPQETLYSISKDYDISEQELISLNPELKKGVKLGMILRVPMKEKAEIKPVINKTQSNLSNSLKINERKKLVMLLPFNISKIESDTVNSPQARLKKDKFLNMTLDFYSGALMAIDSAKTLGLNVDVSIFDSQETKNSSAVASVIQQNNLTKVDAIIGPFYQTNVEKVAEMLETYNTPVISPLSKDSGKSFKNLYQATPTSDQMKVSIFDFMRSKNGNIVAIVDSKKGSVVQYLKEQQKDAKIVGLTDKGTVISDSLFLKLDKNRLNYIIVASEKTGMILSSTNLLVNAQKNYQVQMVILEQNETLDFEEIPLARLTKLNMMYPSLSKSNEKPEAIYFENNYKKINKIVPNQYAVRGFDVTFDTLLRLSQGKTFEETAQGSATEQIESKFDYSANENGGYSNKGVYILQYEADLSITEAK
jgi:LysM repeat protein/ABC-type branched-subunit amino acid transport system substrate-binding protein